MCIDVFFDILGRVFGALRFSVFHVEVERKSLTSSDGHEASIFFNFGPY